MEQEQHNSEEQMNTEENHPLNQEGVQGVLAEEHKASKNMIIVVVIAVIVVVLALMYMWGARVQENMQTPDENLPTLPATDEQTEALKQVSTSDELDAIEDDLDMTDLDNLDADLADLEAEIEAGLVE
jgi:cytoskeletal protein RodZ